MAAKTNKGVQLPIYRVRTIMKSSPEVENISNESIHLVAKATELFIRYMAQESLEISDRGDSLEYRDVAEMVERDQKLEFLKELIPHKITIRQYKDLMQQKNRRCQLSSSSSSESSD